MKAILLNGPGMPFVLDTVPDPTPGPGEAVARVLACGSGLTIHHARAGRLKLSHYPRIIGHEITGEIVAVGAGVGAGDVKIGDGVTAYFYLNCGRCHWCRINRETLCENFGGYVGREIDGGYAEYIKLPARSFLKLPDGIDWRKNPAEAGVICDALATPVKVIRRARITPHDTVAVFGAGGGLGVHMLKVARWARAKKIIAVDKSAAKFETAVKCGADVAIDASAGRVAEQLLEATGGKGVDVAIDFVSNASTLEPALASLGRGGRLVTLGGSGKPFSADPAKILRDEIEILGSRYATRQEVMDTLELVARGEFSALVTDKAPLEQAEALHQRLDKELIIGRAALVMV
jgi:propanol-preferring alcohol dehydrogenase